METLIREYEAYIEKAAARPSAELRAYHREMLANFQHERLIHLIVTLFFATLALVMLAISVVNFCVITDENMATAIVSWGVTGILVMLTAFYVKHYYFLENHVQKLYKISEKLNKTEAKH